MSSEGIMRTLRLPALGGAFGALRFKTDPGETGPAQGQPAIMPAGMRGDRASVIFADPAEIGTFIEKKC